MQDVYSVNLQRLAELFKERRTFVGWLEFIDSLNEFARKSDFTWHVKDGHVFIVAGRTLPTIKTSSKC